MFRYLILGALGLSALAGCGSKTNAVTGKVTFNGQPVTGGSLTFLPASGSEGASASLGKPAVGIVDSTGAYKIVPGADSGGAVAGQHRVVYSAPVTELPPGTELKPGQGPPPSPFDGLRPKVDMVEVKAGSNTIDFELTK